MFRRKDEGAPGSSNEMFSATTPAPAATVTYATRENASPAASASPQPSSAPVSAYTPPPAPSRIPEPSRPSPAAYRPAPVADFSRPGTTRNNTAEAPRSAMVADKLKPNRRVLTVGNDILLKGEIATCDRLVIEGRVEAKLSDVHTVEIAENGSFKGTAEVEDAEISGLFEGDLAVRNRLVIYATGEVRGNISYGEIEIERGGKLTGQIKTVAQQGKVKSIDDAAKARTSKESVAA